jgi:hypothetical protein
MFNRLSSSVQEKIAESLRVSANYSEKIMESLRDSINFSPRKLPLMKPKKAATSCIYQPDILFLKILLHKGSTIGIAMLLFRKFIR